MKLHERFIKENNLQNLTRNQHEFIEDFCKLNTFGTVDEDLVLKLFEFKKKNGN